MAISHGHRKSGNSTDDVISFALIPNIILNTITLRARTLYALTCSLW